MIDNDLIQVVATRLEQASAAAGWHYLVLQKDQPTQQGIPYAPTIFFEKLFDMQYGHPMIDYEHNVYQPVKPNTFSETETQIVETSFQISALVIQEPKDLTLPTASDVAHYLKAYITSRPSIYAYRDLGVKVLRVTQIRNQWFQDERHRYEANPNFDIVYIHDRPLTNTVGAANRVVGVTVPGVAGNGVFPVPDRPYG